jgi:hypothetical protein
MENAPRPAAESALNAARIEVQPRGRRCLTVVRKSFNQH